MKVLRIIENLFNSKHVENKHIIPLPPVVYDRNNVTAKEFREYIHWLAENNINKTVYEPDRFITETERKLLEKRKAELEEYRKFVRYLSENNINRIFIC